MYETPRVERFGSLTKLTLMAKPDIGYDLAAALGCTDPASHGSVGDNARCTTAPDGRS